MAAHRIGELRIGVRATARDAPAAAEVRAYTAAVWETAGDALERRHPGRVYRVRSWQGRWRLTRARLRHGPDPAHVGEVVAACERVAPAAPAVRPDGGAAVVCFAGEAERVAGWWVERAAGRPAHWSWADLDEAPSVAAVLERLGPRAAQDAARVVLAAAERPAEALALAGRVDLGDLPEHAAAAVAPPRPPAPAEPPPAQEHPPERSPGAAPPGALEAGSARPGAARPATSPESSETVREQPAGAEPSAHEDEASVDVRWAARATPDEASPEALRRADALVTAWGGLAHLLGPVLECDLAGILWEACLDERAVLHRAFSALSGGDPLAAILTGRDPGGPLTEPEPLAEVRERLLDVLPRAAARRGLAAWPDLERAAAAGLAGARVAGLPWPVAAWPAADADADAAGGPLWTAPEPRSADAALVTMVAGAPCTLLALRLGWTGDAATFADRWLRRAAAVRDDGTVIEVRFAGELVDLDLRRCGADADPGWVPWLARHVRLVYDVPED